jgi:hypothetical protein
MNLNVPVFKTDIYCGNNRDIYRRNSQKSETSYSCDMQKVPIVIQSRKTVKSQNELWAFPDFFSPTCGI